MQRTQKMAQILFLLETEFNWDGIQVEPNPKLAQQLIEARTSTVINSALVGRARQGSNLFLNLDKGTLNSKRGFKVSTQKLEQVVEKFGTDFQACFIDIEGGEPEVIEDLVFSQIPFDFIAIERIWNSALICKRLESLDFVNIFGEISGYESWWLCSRVFTFKSNSCVAGDGIEPSTSRFSVARSYQLSYPAE